jgi:hypothetical protein
MRLYIDTNVVLGFYRSAPEAIAIFDELKEKQVYLVTTEQTSNEVDRNRTATLSQVIESVRNSVSIQPYTTALVKHLNEFSALIENKKSLTKAADALIATLEEMLEDVRKDPVVTRYSELMSRKETLFLKTTDALVAKAHRRKLLGSPPTSPDKHTVGDELIWEAILGGCDDDLMIVSKDKTFKNNVALLAKEYSSATGRTLAVVETLGAGMKLVGKPSPKVEEQEREVVRDRAILPGPPSKCTRCSGELEEEGYDGSDGDSAWWLHCSKCGAIYFPGQDFPV